MYFNLRILAVNKIKGISILNDFEFFDKIIKRNYGIKAINGPNITPFNY